MEFLENLLKVLHPFMPFISEEIYQYLKTRGKGDSIMISTMPSHGKIDKILLEKFEEVRELVGAIRNIRQEKNLSPREVLHLKISVSESEYDSRFLPLVFKLANIESVEFVKKAEEGAASFLVRTTEYSIPVGDLIDREAEKAKLEDELKYYQGFLASVMKKLGNEKFVNNAPLKVVEMEQKKKADAEEKIKSLNERLSRLNKG